MKNTLLIATFLALTATGFAQRPSLDEKAIRLGVRDWILLHTANLPQLDATQLKTIYRPDVEFTAPTNSATTPQRGLMAYAAVWQPLAHDVQKLAAAFTDETEVSINGAKAMATFTFRPEGTYKDGRPLTCQTRVNLTWERRDGLWKIAREELVPLTTSAPGAVVVAK